MGTSFGPDDRARIVCDPKGDRSVPSLASISMLQDAALLFSVMADFRRAMDRAWIKKILMASSGWVGRERKGLRGALLVELADEAWIAEVGRSDADLLASLLDCSTRLPKELTGCLLDMMMGFAQTPRGRAAAMVLDL